MWTCADRARAARTGISSQGRSARASSAAASDRRPPDKRLPFVRDARIAETYGREYLAATFAEGDVLVALVAYVLTRVAPVASGLNA